MIKKLLKRLPAPVLAAIIAVLLFASASLAVFYLRALPVEVEIIPGLHEIQIYGPPLYETPLTGIKIAILQRGTTHIIALKVKNTGVEPLNIKVKTEPEVIPWAEVWFTPSSLSLTAGQTADMTFSVGVPANTATGNYTFGIMFYEP